MAVRRRPKLAVWKFASCDGCQLSLLDCEDEIVSVAQELEIAYFPEGFRQVTKGPYDISLIEGSITTAHDAERIHKVRRMSKAVIAIGACATSGGIQALRNFKDVKEFTRYVYPRPEYISALSKSTPLSDHINVDYELRGCPISKVQLIETVSSLLNSRKPPVPSYSLCIECKRKGNICVMVAKGIPCLGPVTHAGCDALCPTYNRGCYACFGPKESPNTNSLSRWLGAKSGMKDKDIMRFFRGINAFAEPFRRESEAHE
jgi:sulfhydrogenase subunit delta